MTITPAPETTPASVSALTLEEKASLGSGAAFWTTKAVGSVPRLLLTDGPHGVRKQIAADDHLGIAPSAPATCFPPAAGLAQSWDPALVERVGAALGVEAAERGVNVLLGPGVNIKRDPRCGRNFEYFSEDPVLSGDLGAAWIRGVQSEGVAASVKHFAANNAEHDRMRASSDVEPRALREIYLRSFERAVRGGQPWTVMCSYNRIDGVFAAENRWLLTDVLRGEWGFDGAVVSDWGAVTDRVASVRAGLDLEMPARAGSDDQVVAAVRDGSLSEEKVDLAARRVAALAHRARPRRPEREDASRASHHDLAREAAERSIVLLKNDGDVLPLSRSGRIGVIGEFAATPRFQGGGSSRINPIRVDDALSAIRQAAGDAEVHYAQGFSTSTDEAADDGAQLDAAVRLAEASDVVVVFLGLGDHDESEGFDRDHIELPPVQLRLLARVATANARIVAVLTHGGVVRLAPVTAAASAVLDGALLGEAGGSALARVLFGEVNPAGRLAETAPIRLEDSPSFLSFPGEHGHVSYGEGVFVGYRWYDARRLDVEFPFGHGLSYTSFDHRDLRLEHTATGVRAVVSITNTGARAGREVVQLYTALSDTRVSRAPRELRAFGVVDLEHGEKQDVVLDVDIAALAHWDRRVEGWVVEGGRYLVEVGASSRDIRVSGTITVDRRGDRPAFTAESTISEISEHPAGAGILSALLGGSRSDDAAGQELGMDLARMLASFPLNRLGPFGTPEGAGRLEQVLTALNSED
ncbi:glycoside hydrolase family 3 C-terminal domain-containing protein [Microbacterium sp. NPDC089320]|uniref:glycoside hydrolase family 3 C-terminal domain-containing protein n=1 Tax=Microbacterium sp. NPDC089320 TaxID=3155182 RepID=UPI003430B131